MCKFNILYQFIFLLVLLEIYLIFYFKSESWSLFVYSKIIREKIEGQIEKPFVLDFFDLDCEDLIQNPEKEANFTTNFKNQGFPKTIEEQIRNASDRCSKVHEFFEFPKEPLSREEAEYPLAYGILAYKNVVQILLMLSSFYHPQNEYCIAISESTENDSMDIDLLEDISKCWKNVYFMRRPPASWGSHEIINSVYACFEFLTHLKSDWKYFQYLSGVDVPLKTNLEMVRIFKALNGTPNIEVKDFQIVRLNGKNMSDSPLPLLKSSLSSLVPRQAANEIVASNKTRELLTFLNGTGIPDEAFWGTLLANREAFPISGSISGLEWIENQKKVRKMMPKAVGEVPGFYHYISRHQVWYKNCHGKLQSSSCVFGIGDLPSLIKSKSLVAHKMYIDMFPGTLFCAIKEIQKRARNPELYPFNTEFYEKLPQVEWRRGISLENVTFPELTL